MSKKELPSPDEKLSSVNPQLQANVEELDGTTNDLSTFLNSAEIAVVFLDLKLRIRRFTPAVSGLFALIPSDLGRPLSDLALKFRDGQLSAQVQKVLEKRLPMEDEVTSDKGRVYLRRILPYRTIDNRIEGAVITFVEITERKKAEAELRKSEERNRLMLEGIKEYAIFMLDPDGRIATWNRGAERVLGFSQAEAIGQTLRLIIAPESDAFKEDPLVLARQHGSVTEDGWYVRKGGGRFWGSGLISTLYDSSGELTGYVKVLRDNTERKIADEALREAKRAADAANEAKDQFLANVSHELRTPLSAIVLWASLIEDQKMHDPEQLDEAIRAIRKSAEEQRELIEDLVDNARIIAGKLRLDPKPIDLAAVVHEGVETGRSLASEKKVTLDESSDPDVSRVMVDGGRIKQVVSNLVNNAIKFTPSGGRVDVKLRRAQDEVQIIVADTGVGMTREFIENAFDRFTQVEQATTRTKSGLGLGLAIARQIVELHGGLITVDSPGVGHGCTFMVRMPLPAIPDSDLTTHGDVPSPVGNLLQGQHILLIEDVAATRRALTAVLEEAGAHVDAVDSAPAAWEVYERQRPHAIISDLGLPTIDGYAFMRQIRETESDLKTTRTPALALTAFAGDGVNTRALESGFHVCLTKPIAPVTLVTSLATLMKQNGSSDTPA